MAAQTQTPEEFIADVKNKPIYVAFFHGEFETCSYEPDPPRMTVPDNIAIMQLTQPGEMLLLNSQILFFLIHKKQFYTETLMPLFTVRSPLDLVEHRNANYIYWDMEQLKNLTPIELMDLGKKLETSEATEALKKFRLEMTKEKYEPHHKTHFSNIHRFMNSDTVPNIRLSPYDEKKHFVGFGVYKFSPSTGKVDKIMAPFLSSDEIRLETLTQYITRNGGGRLVLFSCNSLKDSKVGNTNAVVQTLGARNTVRKLHEKYIRMNPVMSPERDWDMYETEFPNILIPDLAFQNQSSLKALNNSVLSWIYYKIFSNILLRENMPSTRTNIPTYLRSIALQNTALHGRLPQNLGQNLGNIAPAVGESTLGFCCRRGRKKCSDSCAIMGGRTRRYKTNKKSTRRRYRKK